MVREKLNDRGELEDTREEKVRCKWVGKFPPKFSLRVFKDIIPFFGSSFFQTRDYKDTVFFKKMRTQSSFKMSAEPASPFEKIQ